MNSPLGNLPANIPATQPEAMLAPHCSEATGPQLAPKLTPTKSVASSSEQVFSSLTGRIALNQLTTFRNSLSADLAEYRRHQVPAIGLNWQKLVREGLRRSLRKIQSSNLPVSSIGWIGGFTGEHGHTLSDAVQDAKKIIRFAGQVRAKTVTVITGPQAGHIRSHAVRITCDTLRVLSDFAANYNVTLALQPMHAMYAKSWTFLNSLDDALLILDRVNHPYLQLAFGTYHLWEEPNLLQRLPEVARRIQLVTLADWGPVPRHEQDRLLPGEGELPLSSTVHALEANGFSGWYELEVWSRDLWKLESRDLMRKCSAARQLLSSVPATF